MRGGIWLVLGAMSLGLMACQVQAVDNTVIRPGDVHPLPSGSSDEMRSGNADTNRSDSSEAVRRNESEAVRSGKSESGQSGYMEITEEEEPVEEVPAAPDEPSRLQGTGSTKQELQ